MVYDSSLKYQLRSKEVEDVKFNSRISNLLRPFWQDGSLLRRRQVIPQHFDETSELPFRTKKWKFK